ncbi:MAG: hypothetical protein ACE5D7_08210 [Fidelibacterota bacterium]
MSTIIDRDIWVTHHFTRFTLNVALRQYFGGHRPTCTWFSSGIRRAFYRLQWSFMGKGRRTFHVSPVGRYPDGGMMIGFSHFDSSTWTPPNRDEFQ